MEQPTMFGVYTNSSDPLTEKLNIVIDADGNHVAVWPTKALAFDALVDHLVRTQKYHINHATNKVNKLIREGVLDIKQVVALSKERDAMDTKFIEHVIRMLIDCKLVAPRGMAAIKAELSAAGAGMYNGEFEDSKDICTHCGYEKDLFCTCDEAVPEYIRELSPFALAAQASSQPKHAPGTVGASLMPGLVRRPRPSFGAHQRNDDETLRFAKLLSQALGMEVEIVDDHGHFLTYRPKSK